MVEGKKRGRFFWLWFIAAMLLPSCAGLPQSAEPMAAGAAARGDASQLLMVDCLLPGQVRKLGGQMTYLTARRPIRTSAIDCEIRGGEYVAYDRANYTTALKVWLPAAKSGDARAQNYVGQIYEKGLGITPDYVTAAEWYRRAAEQGDSAAAINLGYLHERGLGVEQNTTEALNWYRTASGFPRDGELEFVTSVEVSARQTQQQELVELREAVAEHKAEEARLRQELDLLRQEKADRAQSLKESEAAAAALRRRVQAVERDLALARARIAEVPPPTAASELRDETANLEREVARQETQRRDLQVQLAAKEVQLAQLQASLDQATTELGLAQASRDAALTDLQTARAELASVQQLGTEERDKVKALQDEIRARERALADREGRLSQLNAQIGNKSDELTAALSEAQAQESFLKDELARRDRTLLALREQFLLTQERLREVELAAASRTQELSEARAKLQAQHERAQESEAALKAEAEAELDRLRADLAAREAEIAKQQASIAQLEEKSANHREQLAELAEAENQSLAQQAPTIEIIDPPLAVTRGLPSIRLRSIVPQVQIIGRVDAPAGLMLAVPEESDNPVSIVAIDRKGRRAAVDFLLIKPRGEASLPLDGKTKGATIRVGDVDFGHYYALVIGNQNYRHLPKLTTPRRDFKAQSVNAVTI